LEPLDKKRKELLERAIADGGFGFEHKQRIDVGLCLVLSWSFGLDTDGFATDITDKCSPSLALGIGAMIWFDFGTISYMTWQAGFF